MPKNKYQKAKQCLDELKHQAGDNIPFSILKKSIMEKIGADENRTVRPYVKFMLDMGMIEQASGGAYVYIRT